MNEEYYCDDYDQEYAEGYSAYKCDSDVYHEEPVQKRHKETPQTSDIAPHHILLGSIVAALGHAALKKSATKHRQQQARQRTQHVAPQSTYATEWDKKTEGHIMNGCAAIVATATIIFFVWLFI